MAKKNEAKEYKIEKKRSGRYAVIDKNGKYVHAEAKVEILLKEGVIKQSKSQKKKEETPSAAAEPAAE